MKKVYRLIVNDTLKVLNNNKNKSYDEVLSLCTLDEIEEIIRNYKGNDFINLKKWFEEKRSRMAQFINYVNSSSFSEYYLDNNYSIDFLNSLRRILGLEVRFYKDKEGNVNQIEFILDDNELRIDSIISDSIKRQRDKNSRLRGYANLDEERKYQLFYNNICLKEGKNDNTKGIKAVVDKQKDLEKIIEKSLSRMSNEELQTIIRKDQDYDYSETKDQLLKIIESYGYTKDMVEKVNIDSFYQ